MSWYASNINIEHAGWNSGDIVITAQGIEFDVMVQGWGESVPEQLGLKVTHSDNMASSVKKTGPQTFHVIIVPDNHFETDGFTLAVTGADSTTSQRVTLHLPEEETSESSSSSSENSSSSSSSENSSSSSYSSSSEISSSSSSSDSISSSSSSPESSESVSSITSVVSSSSESNHSKETPTEKPVQSKTKTTVADSVITHSENSTNNTAVSHTHKEFK